MKCHPLAECDLQSAVIEPPPPTGQARYQRAILADFDEMLERVQHNVLPTPGGLIDNMQFPPRRGDLFPQAPGAPPEGDEHEREAPHKECVHGGSSLVTD